MPKFPTREDSLRTAVVEFERSARTVDDYIGLFGAAHNCLKQGLGLGWDTIEDITRAALKEARLGDEATVSPPADEDQP